MLAVNTRLTAIAEKLLINDPVSAMLALTAVAVVLIDVLCGKNCILEPRARWVWNGDSADSTT
jgi:hypothetical protein